MRRLLGTMAVSGMFAISGAAWACGDMADNHDDSFAQMTKPQPTATPVKKTSDTQQAVQKVDKRQARATQPAAAPVKVAARTTTSD